MNSVSSRIVRRNPAVQYFSPAYEAYLSRVDVRPTALFVDFYTIDASSQHDHFAVHHTLEEILLSHGMTALDMERFVVSVFEGVQNAKMHAYNFKPGERIRVHLRITPFDYTATVHAGGARPDMEKIRSSFDGAQRYVQIMEDINNQRISKEKAREVLMPLLVGSRGKGFKDMFLACDWVRFEEYDGHTYLTLVKLNNKSLN